MDEHRTEAIDIAAARRVAGALSEVTVVDPACGSGAYLLGMMQELVELQTVLYNAGADARTLYDLKLEIIERNLYGVDIDEFAVNIARLRMWLSLAIDFDGDKPEPLPNLDFKVVCGNSLLGPDPSQLNLERVHIEQSGLGRLKAAYMIASDASEKGRLRNEIHAAERDVRERLADAAVPDGVVDWRVAFAEVIGGHGGFDIAIANPPYVRMEQIKSVKQSLAALYPDVYAGRADYFVYFFSRAVQSLRPNGVLAFITSSSYMRAGYGRKLRGYLAGCLTLSQIVDFSELPVFTATVDTTVLVGLKRPAEDGHTVQVADLGPPVSQAVAQRGLTLTPQVLNRTMENLPSLLSEHSVTDYPQAMLDEDGWMLEDPALVNLFERLMNLGTPLGEFVGDRIYMGIKTGRNEAFVIDRAQRDALIESIPGAPRSSSRGSVAATSTGGEQLGRSLRHIHESRRADHSVSAIEGTSGDVPDRSRTTGDCALAPVVRTSAATRRHLRRVRPSENCVAGHLPRVAVLLCRRRDLPSEQDILHAV